MIAQMCHLALALTNFRALSYGMQQPRYLFMYLYCSVLFCRLVFILANGNFPMFHLCSNTVTVLSVSSYRPISILPKLSLVFEMLLYRHLHDFIERKIHQNHFGFVVATQQSLN